MQPANFLAKVRSVVIGPDPSATGQSMRSFLTPMPPSMAESEPQPGGTEAPTESPSGQDQGEQVATLPTPQKKSKAKPKPKRQPKYNVLLWDDDQHSYEYVIEMMSRLFGHTFTKGLRIAYEVDHHGVAICLTTTMEHAELKREQILAFGRDHSIASSTGPMKATIEPVEAS